MTMETHYFVFGQSHTEDLRGYWVEIVADSAQKARRKMYQEFGAMWECQYRERQFMRIYQQFPKGCYKTFEVD